MEKPIFKSKKQIAIMSTKTATKNVIIVGIINSLIEKEKIIVLDNTKTTHSNICQNH